MMDGRETPIFSECHFASPWSWRPEPRKQWWSWGSLYGFVTLLASMNSVLSVAVSPGHQAWLHTIAFMRAIPGGALNPTWGRLVPRKAHSCMWSMAWAEDQHRNGEATKIRVKKLAFESCFEIRVSDLYWVVKMKLTIESIMRTDQKT